MSLLRVLVRRLARWVREERMPVEQRRVAPVVPLPPSRELVEARLALHDALDDLPRDQGKVNRLRVKVMLLEAPNGPESGLHRRGVTR